MMILCNKVREYQSDDEKAKLAYLALRLSIYQALQQHQDFAAEKIGEDLTSLLRDVLEDLKANQITVKMLETKMKAALKMLVLAEDNEVFNTAWDKIAAGAQIEENKA